jgi:alpha-N-arabinofuranosidase
MYVALVNTNPHQAADVVLNLAGQTLKTASGRVLTAAAMDAHNSMQAPQAVKPAPFNAAAKDGKLTLNVPAKAVIVVAVE